MTTIEQTLLAPALSRCAHIANNTHPIPALQTIRLGSGQNGIVLEASNGRSDISETVPCDGKLDQICVNGSRLNSIIRSMTGTIKLETNKANLFIEDNYSKIKLPLFGLEDFPPTQGSDCKAIGLSCPDLAKAIDAVAGFSFNELGRDNLQGVQVISNPKQLITMGTDGRFLACHEQALIGAETNFLVPNHAVTELVKALDREEAVLEQGETMVRIRHKSGHFSFRLLELAFPVKTCRDIIKSELVKLGQIDPGTIKEPLGVILSCAADRKLVNIDLDFNKAGLNIVHLGEELAFERLVPGQYPDNLTRVDGKRFLKVLQAMEGPTEVSTFHSGLCFKNKDLTVFLFGIIQASSKQEPQPPASPEPRKEK